MQKGNNFKIHSEDTADHSCRCKQAGYTVITFITSFIFKFTLLK